MKILFLDLDGVANDHNFNEVAQSNTFLRSCVVQLNRIIDETDCKIVLISAWRYIILGGDMTLRGFEYLMRTHGINATDRLIGYTNYDIEKDGVLTDDGRAELIIKWMNAFGGFDTPYCILDDLDLGFTDNALNFVQTDGEVGLTCKEADEVISILNGG